jgi:hypothetical protein
MPNRSNYQRWFMERYNATDESRDEGPAAPAARARAIGTVNPYWIQQAEKRQASRLKRQAASRKRQAASDKLDK